MGRAKTAAKPTVVVVGPGATGRSLAGALTRAGWPPAGIIARTAAAADDAAARLGLAALGTPDLPDEAVARADALLLTVRDRDIEPVAATLARTLSRVPSVALHASGALSSDALAALRERGAACGSFHPLMTFAASADAPPAPLPRDTPFACEGDEAAVALALRLAAALGCPALVLPATAKVAYHAAATLAGNLTTALVGAAAEVLAAVGLPDGAALVHPLARESLANAARIGAAAALTGPVARGDAETVRRHLGELERLGLPAELRRAHAAVSRHAVDLARARVGAPREALDEIARILDEALIRLDAAP